MHPTGPLLPAHANCSPVPPSSPEGTAPSQAPQALAETPSPAPRAPTETPAMSTGQKPGTALPKALAMAMVSSSPMSGTTASPTPMSCGKDPVSGAGTQHTQQGAEQPLQNCSTHLHHALEGDGAVGRCQGEARWPEGWEALGDAAREPEGLRAQHLEGVSHQASKQDNESVACCRSGESNCESCPAAGGAGMGIRAAEDFPALEGAQWQHPWDFVLPEPPAGLGSCQPGLYQFQALSSLTQRAHGRGWGRGHLTHPCQRSRQ